MGTYLYLYVLQLWCWWWEGGKMYVFIKRLSDMKGPGQLALWSYGKLLRNCSYGMSLTMLSGCVFLWHMVKYTFIYVQFMCGNMLTLPPIEFQSTIWIFSHLPLNIQLNGSKPTVFKLSIVVYIKCHKPICSPYGMRAEYELVDEILRI